MLESVKVMFRLVLTSVLTCKEILAIEAPSAEPLSVVITCHLLLAGIAGIEIVSTTVSPIASEQRRSSICPALGVGAIVPPALISIQNETCW